MFFSLDPELNYELTSDWRDAIVAIGSIINQQRAKQEDKSIGIGIAYCAVQKNSKIKKASNLKLIKRSFVFAHPIFS